MDKCGSQGSSRGVVPSPTVKKLQPPMLIKQTLYFLNKSKSKFVSIGLAQQLRFTPVVQLWGMKNQGVWFSETEWKQLVENQGVLLNYFYATDTPWSPMKLGFKTIYFQTVEQKRVIKIEDMCETEIYLGWESLLEFVELIPLIDNQLKMISNHQFRNYYNDMLNKIVIMTGDCMVNIKKELQSAKECANTYAMMELLHFHPEKIAVDLEMVKCMM